MIVVNKWDTIPNKNQQTATYYEQDVRDKLRLLSWAPVVYSSAISGHSVDKYDPILSILIVYLGAVYFYKLIFEENIPYEVVQNFNLKKVKTVILQLSLH